MTRKKIERLNNHLDWHEYPKYGIIVPKTGTKKVAEIANMSNNLSFVYGLKVGIFQGLYNTTYNIKRRT